MKNFFIYLGIFCLMSYCFQHGLIGQTDRKIVEERDSAIIVNTDLKMEILELKKKVAFLQGRISKLRGNVNGLTKNVKQLTAQEQKTKGEYEALEKYAREIIAANDTIKQTNTELLLVNNRIKKSKESFEVAANALEEVLDNEREKMIAQTNSFKRNYASGCTDVTHQGKQGTIVLDEYNTHKISWIHDLNLRVSTCYALPRAEASTNVKMYFYLYRLDDIERKQPLENSIPIILTPNLVVSDESIIYYEGSLDVLLPTGKKAQRNLRTSFIYEVEYQEEIVANGRFKLD